MVRIVEWVGVVLPDYERNYVEPRYQEYHEVQSLGKFLEYLRDISVSPVPAEMIGLPGVKDGGKCDPDRPETQICKHFVPGVHYHRLSEEKEIHYR